MKKNKRLLIILLFIAAILAVMNFAHIMYYSFITNKIPGLYPKNNWEVELPLKYRKKQHLPKVTLKETDDPGVYFILDDLECTYTDFEDIDFLQEVVLDSILPAGELLKEINYIYAPGESWCLLKKKSDGRTVIISREKPVFKKILCRKSGLKEWFDELNTEELILSMNYDLQYYVNYSGDLKSFLERLQGINSGLINEKYYRIFIQPETSDKGSIFKVKGEYLKDLLASETIIYSSGRRTMNNDLREAIVHNKEIPFELKSNIMAQYVRAILDVRDSTFTSKTERLDFLLKMIEENPGKFISNHSDYAQDIDQYIVQYAMIQFNRFNLFTPAELIYFCDRVIEIAGNPETILRAFIAKTCALLKIDDFEAAQKFAFETLQLYKKPYKHKPVDGVLNGQAILFCIEYELKKRQAPEIILKHIDQYYKKSYRFPEFRNNLLFIKAVVLDLTDSPVNDVIKAYEKVDMNYSSNYSGYNYLNSLTHVLAAKSAIDMLKSQIEIKVTINTPVNIRKCLFINESQVLNENETMDITIIQHGLPEIEKKIIRMSTSNWKKGIINGDIYWFTTDRNY